MNKPANWILSRAEKFLFFAAMLLAIALEGGSVYWLASLNVASTPAGAPANLVGQWTAATLPQCWLLGALLVLFYRASAMLAPPQRWSQAEARSNRRAFIRLWLWTVAVGVLQVSTVWVGRFTIGAQ